MPIVNATASTAVASRPARPNPTAIRSASGTFESVSRRDADVAHRKPDVEHGDDPEGERHRAGSSLAGRRNSPASWAIASQPMKSHTRMFAAVPTAHQPCGANGVQSSPPREGSATPIAIADHDDQHRGQPELEAGGDAQPERVRGEHGARHREPDARRDGRAAAGQVGDVVAADQRDGRRAEDDRGEEPRRGDRGALSPNRRARRR